ncbi:MAG: CoB--CoM heterodisulfide reductase iron-sulfur subunit A family protein [Chloroflexi bacterium]|nr:CoB--CoM heterodisulfide reductase iron-sulfur subunit A family protein [Chloroflexota bacterium]
MLSNSDAAVPASGIGADPIGAVMVVGGGIAGMQASLDLASSGIKVYLVESLPAIGGKMVQLDKTFPTNDCATCIVSPKLVDVARNPNIELLTYTEVISVSGAPGDFHVKVREKARYVDVDKCNGCGECARACVWKNRVPSEFDRGMSKRAAAYIPFAQAVPLKATIDPETCLLLGGRKCVAPCSKNCGPKAIDFTQKDKEREFDVGAVIVAPGYELYDPKLSEELGFGRYPNVLTSLQFERLLSASGPTRGAVLRPSDQHEPHRIAFIQCVGSRDQKHDYCSSVCCMYSTKEAMLAKEHAPDVDINVFMMDIRAFGKGFDAYYERAQRDYGIRYTRCRPSSIKEVPSTRNLLIKYQTEDGRMVEEEFDLVVLAVGMEPAKGAKELAATLGIELNAAGFCKTAEFAPLDTSKPGVFVCGPFVEPMDIPDSVMTASGAAAKALELVALSRDSLVSERVYPAEKDVSGEEPHIGVFICHCGTNIAGVVDVKSVAEYASKLPGVVHAETTVYACSQDNIQTLKYKMAEHGLNRVVIAACTPRTHEPLFQDTMREVGLNPFLFEMANIRDQCSWVHSKDPAGATQKSKDLVRMAIARSRTLSPLYKESLGVNGRAVVVGGGVAGMTAALSLANQGFGVYLVEREKELGGNLRNLRSTVGGQDPRIFMNDLIERVQSHGLIDVYTDATVTALTGFVGNYKCTVRQAGVDRVLDHGALIVATGGKEYRGDEYLYGQDPRVITQLELEHRIADSPGDVARARNVVMIQCVGPAAKSGGYCSRICCTTSLKNAIKIKELNPSANVFVLAKDVRTYGFKEQVYTEARAKGVVFLRYDEDHEPRVEATGNGLRVSLADHVLREEVAVDADLLVLTTGIVPNEGNDALAPALKVPLTKEGFFLEAHIKLRPVDFASEGLFVCGLAHYPKFIEESIAQALATSARAATVLSRPQLEVGGAVAVVDQSKCAGCLTCVRVCPYHVPKMNFQGVAEIEVAECHGCGTCVAECPAKAIQLLHYRDDQITVKAEALLAEVA